jgi:hypothetical protein
LTVPPSFYRDHAPPHFHATYGEFDIEVTIADGIVSGRFPRRALRHVLEWYDLHKDELSANWERAAQRRPLKVEENLAAGVAQW